MESACQRLKTLRDALETLDDILREPASAIVRDATIQRFEYTTEAAWKALKHYLLDQHGVECNSPKSCIRAAFGIDLLSEEETERLLEMIDDRNLTSHTYIEAVAVRIASRIPDYACVMHVLAENIRNSLT